MLLVGCQGARPDGTVGETRSDPASADGSQVLGGPGAVATRGRASVDLGAYADDARVVALAERWPEIVDRAVARLPQATGLAFPPTKPPRVRLAPLGDEYLDYVVTATIQEGRRVPALTVNVEPLAAGRRDVERVLMRGLAAAVFEDTTQRRGAPPAYVVTAAETVAAGDFADLLVRLARDARDAPLAVDPGDPRAARATAAAALILLQPSGDDALRRFLRFTAEGDDPDDLLARVVRDPVGSWAGRGRAALAERLERVDTAPWRLLARAREALREAGRGAMESVLPQTLPPEIAAEITVLSAQAHADEGDYESVRRLLETFASGGTDRLEDAGAAAALRVRAERASGGDARLAARLEAEWLRDYPRLAARRAATDVDRGAGPSNLARVRRRVEALLAAHEAGAASRTLAELGERALAPELADVQRAVVQAESMPSAEAVEVNRLRVRAWWAGRGTEEAAAVRAGGAAAALALGASLPEAAGPGRRAGVRLLGEAGGTGRAVELLGPVWRRRPDLLEGDLDALLAAATWPELSVWVRGVAGEVRGVDTVWAQLRYGIDEAWIRAHPQVLSDLRSTSYPVRREAFDTAVDGGHATPALVAHGLRDAAPLMRRAAVEVAGRQAFGALIRVALRDDAWMVRQAACPAAARGAGADAPDLLLTAYRRDPSVPVRLAAAGALFELDAPGRGVLDALVQGLMDPEPAVRDLCAARLPGLDPQRVVPAVVAALEEEARRPQLDGPALARLCLVLQRTSRRDVRYVPGMSRAEVRALLDGVHRWADRGGR